MDLGGTFSSISKVNPLLCTLHHHHSALTFTSLFFSPPCTSPIQMRAALNPATGVICTQGECQWLHLDFISGVIGQVRELFPVVQYAYTTIPTYPSGQIGFLIASLDKDNNVAVPSREVPESMPLRYYSEEIHKASFVLPAFAAKKLAAPKL